MTKADYIKNGLADNPGMMPKELAEALNKRRPKDMTEIKPLEISTYKSKAKKAAEEAAATPTAPQAPVAPIPTKTAALAAEANGAAPDTVKAAREVKALCDKYGPEVVTGLAGLFGGK